MFWLIVSLIVAAVSLVAYLDTRKPKGFPPGPRWYPIIGSILEMSKMKARLGSFYETTLAASRKYGPIVGLKIVDQLVVVVHGHEAIKEMSLSEDCVGRPTGTFYEMRTWNKRLGVILVDEAQWQNQKRFLMRHLKQFGYGSRSFFRMVEEECAHLVDFIKKSMGDEDFVVMNLEKMFNVTVLNALWRVIAGVRYSPEASKMKTLQSLNADLFRTCHMTGAPFTYFPILRYVAPEMSGYKKYVETHNKIWEFLQQELDEHKQVHDPNNPKDLIDAYLDVLQTPDHGEFFSEQQLMAICLDMFMAGSETTNNSISIGMTHLVLNPDVRKKAQQEIDSVLEGRQATMEDRPNMPYMESVMLESLRMFTSRAFSLPHRALRDTYLGGYRIPKDTTLLANYHDSTLGPKSGFVNPDSFNPGRYLIDGKLTVPESFTPFGVGKRRCLGDTLARANVFLIITSLLQNFDVETLPDYPHDMVIVDGVTPCLLQYKAKFVRRRR